MLLPAGGGVGADMNVVLLDTNCCYTALLGSTANNKTNARIHGLQTNVVTILCFLQRAAL
jgi:hypothetical protein